MSQYLQFRALRAGDVIICPGLRPLRIEHVRTFERHGHSLASVRATLLDGTARCTLTTLGSKPCRVYCPDGPAADGA